MTNTLTAEQTRIAELENALRQARDAIMKAAEDTLWLATDRSFTLYLKDKITMEHTIEIAETKADLTKQKASA